MGSLSVHRTCHSWRGREINNVWVCIVNVGVPGGGREGEGCLCARVEENSMEHVTGLSCSSGIEMELGCASRSGYNISIALQDKRRCGELCVVTYCTEARIILSIWIYKAIERCLWYITNIY